MTTVDQRWQTVVPLVVGIWQNVWSTLAQYQHGQYENQKAIPFILLALERRAFNGSTKRIAQNLCFLFGSLKQRWAKTNS